LTYVKSKPRIRKKYPVAKESYDEPKTLLNLIDRFLRYQEWRDGLNMSIIAGEMTEGHAVKHRIELQHEKDNIDKAKVDVLNIHIFPAMANLTVLLEKMREHPYIREVFEDDIKVLFLTESCKEPGNPIFFRFLRACLHKHTPDETRPADEKPDFRYVLCMFMQIAVYKMVEEGGPHEFDLAAFLKDILFDDMKRSLGWTKVFAQQPLRELNSDRKNRPELFERRPAQF
jgi:hypothetical protein